MGVTIVTPNIHYNIYNHYNLYNHYNHYNTL